MSERVEKGQLTVRHRGQDEAHSIRAKATESQVRAGEGEEEQRAFMWEQLGGEREGAGREEVKTRREGEKRQGERRKREDKERERVQGERGREDKERGHSDRADLRLSRRVGG